MYKTYRPDTVTMDIAMSYMNGVQAEKVIKKLDLTEKIIMCSAMGQQTMVLGVIKAGA